PLSPLRRPRSFPYTTLFRSGHWDVLWFHFYGATASAYYQAFLQQTHGQAAASLPVDSPVSAQMGTLLSLAGTDSELVRDLDASRSEEHTSELQSRFDIVCRL